ncbi:NAD(P)/FAD-dependent oxidoreductase [Candidatus Sumerlaeota bacterium]|nr:NAD(P)/FAD-dependent oxidoreductase [Candidatus Sumerlaeota bacterium]
MPERTCRIAIIGAGPAGMAAAVSAVEAGAENVLVIDDNPRPGGQIWRGETDDATAREWMQKFEPCGAALLGQTRIVAAPQPGVLLAENGAKTLTIRYEKLILATGASERFLPFPGWTRPNVMGAGGLQTLAKGGLPLEGKRVVVAGSGPLLLAVADEMWHMGARIKCIAEQAAPNAVMRLGLRLLGSPGKLAQAVQLKLRLFGVPYRMGWHPLQVDGADGTSGDDSDAPVASVTLTNGAAKRIQIPCDYLACAFHLTPRLELAHLLGCDTEWIERQCQRRTTVDAWQRSSVEGVYCAGESTGVGGVDAALIEGRIAGYAATGAQDRARPLLKQRDAWRRFADAMNETFAPRPELRMLPEPRTIICRCEDVRYEQVVAKESWRAAKLHTRHGMGACQGRICGGAAEFLFDWSARSSRPPVCPTRMKTLAERPSADQKGD